MRALVAGEGKITFRPAIPDIAPSKSAMCVLVIGEGVAKVTFRSTITDTAPLEVSDVRSGGC